MAKIKLKNKDYHVYTDHRAKDALKRYSCDVRELLMPLADVKFNEPEKCRNITIELKINEHAKGSFIVQPTKIETQNWFILTFSNIVESPRMMYDTKYQVRLACGHKLLMDTTVDNPSSSTYYECHICKKNKK